MAWDEYLFWQKNDKQKINKINELLKDISIIATEAVNLSSILLLNQNW
jgi:Txe/YoeB family toxin of Txe-Axe toxin-antitoxin module